ncbi:hypothetical protein Tco_0054730, partial [Tanacetum coccineum]
MAVSSARDYDKRVPLPLREEPHNLDTSLLDRVADRTTSHASAGTAIPRASQRKLLLPGLIIRSSKKGSEAGSSGHAARDRVKHDDNGTLDDDDQRDGLEFAMEDIESFHNVSPDKEVEHDVERSGGVRRTNRASFRTSH